MRKLTVILVATFVLYFAVAYVSSSFPNFDSTSYKIIGTLTLNGKTIYPNPAISRHPYLPFFLYFEAITQVASSFLKVPQILIIKIALTFFHLLSVFALYVLSKKNLKTVFLYAINPISLLITAFHGQFDSIPITCILFAIIALQNKQFMKTILLLSVAITIKTWPILFIIPFFKRIPKKFWLFILILPSIFLLLYSYFFHTPIFSILRVLLVYQGVPGIWGFGKLLSFISTQKIFLFCYKILFVIGIFFASFKQKKKPLVEELFELLFLFFIFTPGFGLQWFLWLIPFFFLTKKPYVYIFISALTICLSISYLSWPPFTLVQPQVVNAVLFFLWPLFGLYYLFFFSFPKIKYTS